MGQALLARVLGLLLAGAAPPSLAPAPARVVQDVERWPAHMPRVEVRASSQLGEEFAPWRVLDGYAAGVWCEGRSRPGTGQEVVLTFARPVALGRVRVEAGMQVSREPFVASSVPVRLELAVDGKVVAAADRALGALPAAAATRGATTDFSLGGAPVQALALRLREVGPRGRGLFTCVSEVELQGPLPEGSEEDEEGGAALQPIFLEAAAYDALPGALHRLLEGLRTCDAAALGHSVRFPFSYDYVDTRLSERAQEVAAQKGAEVMSTITFEDAAQLARTCRSAPREVPRAPGVTRVSTLLGDLSVESPTAVSVLVPQPGGRSEQWWLGWAEGAWRLRAVRE